MESITCPCFFCNYSNFRCGGKPGKGNRVWRSGLFSVMPSAGTGWPSCGWPLPGMDHIQVPRSSSFRLPPSWRHLGTQPQRPGWASGSQLPSVSVPLCSALRARKGLEATRTQPSGLLTPPTRNSAFITLLCALQGCMPSKHTVVLLCTNI